MSATITKSNASIGLFGFGTVGEGLHLLLNNTTSVPARIRQIVVKDREKERSLPSSQFQFEKNSILNNPTIDLVVELISNAHEAFDITAKSIQEGKPIVSANKKMIAHHLQELIDLQSTYAGSIYYEAAVCGSIPIIQLLERYFQFEPIQRIRGIFNGTSNYILTRIEEDRLSFNQALKKAQELGFAESDPTSDVGGYDALYKLIILSFHAFGSIYKPEEILRMGIQNLTEKDIAFAKNSGRKIRLVPTAEHKNGKLLLFVLPQLIDSDDDLYTIRFETNAVELIGEHTGKQFYSGLGAGAFPTSSAVLSDVQSALNGWKYGYRKQAQQNQLPQANDEAIDVYVRCTTHSLLTSLPFTKVKEGYIDNDYRYIVGKILLSDLKKHAPSIEEDGGIIIRL
ncbi:MAG: homoserine dehydrogenase [Flavobacteriales bacterium]|jgi:homoserine dehydrogenase